MECLIAIGALLVAIIGIYIGSRFSSKPQALDVELEKTAWQKLAKEKDLEFISGDGPKATALSGPYQGCLLTLKAVKKENTAYTFILMERQEPAAIKIEEKALDKLAGIVPSDKLPGVITLDAGGDRIYYEQPGLETSLDKLNTVFRRLHALLTVYPQVLHLEGEAIPRLLEIGQASTALQPVCLQLIVDICQQATQRAAENWVPRLCPRCLIQFELLTVVLPDGGRITYFGCRACGQSRHALPLPAKVVAVLDSQDAREQVQLGDALRVNWLVRREMFDFDQVEIAQATDEDIERFAVQVGNDTDEMRQPRYATMVCTILPECKLSKDSIRILEQVFGRVIKRTP